MNVSEARTAPLDKAGIKRFVVTLVDDLLEVISLLPENEPIGDRHELMKAPFHTNDVKTGEDVSFFVYVRSDWMDDLTNVFVGAGAGRVNGELLIELFVNGRYEPKHFLPRGLSHNIRDHLIEEFYGAMLHEVTHAGDDVYNRNAKPRYLNADNEIKSDEDYHNDPREVIAFTQEAVDAALHRAEELLKRDPSATHEQVVNYVLDTKIMRRLTKFMDGKNLGRVMKAVYASLREAGHL